MDCSTPGLPVHHQLPESTQTHVHWVGDTIQPSHPLSSPSPPAFNLSQHQGLFKWPFNRSRQTQLWHVGSSSLTREGTGSMDSQPLDQQGGRPRSSLLKRPPSRGGSPNHLSWYYHWIASYLFYLFSLLSVFPKYSSQKPFSIKVQTENTLQTIWSCLNYKITHSTT